MASIFPKSKFLSYFIFMKLKFNIYYLFTNKNSCNKYFRIKRSELTWLSLKRMTLWLTNPILWM